MLISYPMYPVFSNNKELRAYDRLLSLITFRSQNDNPGGCYESQSSIAATLGITRESVNRGIKALVAGGWIILDGYFKNTRLIKLTVKTIHLLKSAYQKNESVSETPKDYSPKPNKYITEFTVKASSTCDTDITTTCDADVTPPVTQTSHKIIYNNILNKRECEAVNISQEKQPSANLERPRAISDNKPQSQNNADVVVSARVPLPKSFAEVKAYFAMHKGSVEQAKTFYLHFQSIGWKCNGGTGAILYDWHAKAILWLQKDLQNPKFAERVHTCEELYNRNDSDRSWVNLVSNWV